MTEFAKPAAPEENPPATPVGAHADPDPKKATDPEAPPRLAVPSVSPGSVPTLPAEEDAASTPPK